MKTTWVVLLVLLGGCGETFSNAAFEADERFLGAVPRSADLGIGVPVGGEATPGALTAEPAELYVATYQTALRVDREVLGLLRDIEKLVESPPLLRADDSRIWGPFVHPLDPYEASFAMTEVDGAFEFAYQRRLAGRDGPWETPLSGRYDPRERRGELEVPRARAAYAFGEDRALELELDASEAASPFRLALSRAPDGAGDMELATVDEDGIAVELRSRWRADGAGRADLVWHGPRGDATLGECWGPSFAQVWRSTPEVGAEAACAFPGQALPGRVEGF